jgi:phosphopantothenoylcysteine decarboxylase/phosphopantothenate--cysteine ligase
LDIKISQKLKGKRVLITAGPTWVPIDSVRVISNIATGETGLLLAQELSRTGAKVTLVLGPSGICCVNRSIRLVRFKFFDELKKIITRELTSKKYDIVIHSAAVSDYRPLSVLKKKIPSGRRKLQIELVPTPKIIDAIRKIDRNLYLVGFKFQPNAGRKLLIKKTEGLFRRSKPDLVVANTLMRKRYQAFIVDSKTVYGPLADKKAMTGELIRLIRERL